MKMISSMLIMLFSIQSVYAQDTIQPFRASFRPSENDSAAVHFQFHMMYDSIPGVKVSPYYSQIKSIGHFSNDSTVLIQPQKELIYNKNYWFNYSPSVQSNYIDMGELVDEGPYRDYKSYPEIQLNCSKIINSKGKDVYIYYTTVLGIVKLEKQNPCIAFEGMNHYNTTDDYWNTREFLSRNGIVGIDVGGIDLPEGTYLFNWYDEKDSLHKIMKHLWHLKSEYDIECQKIDYQTEDSLRNLYRSTLNKDFLDRAEKERKKSYNDWIEIRDMFSHNYKMLCEKIYDLGYGINETEYLFSIYQTALISHKISDKTISPEKLQQYIINSDEKPKEVKELLDVFEMYNPYIIYK